MYRIEIDELAADWRRYDASVASSAHLDRFCSSSDWILPASEALMLPRTPWLFRDGDAYLALMRGTDPRGFSYVEPLEAAWGLACPLVGQSQGELAELLAAACARHPDEWDVVVLCGILDGSPLRERVLARLGRRYRLHAGATTTRHVASLAGGLDGFLARRSRNFRKSLRRAEREARAAGIAIEVGHGGEVDADTLFARLIAVEERSWKGKAGVGIDGGGMRAFYRRMIARLHERGRLRLLFGRQDGVDVAYILGGVFGDTYRGLQFSYDARLGNVGLGNVCQLRQIEALCAEGVHRYDLGTTGIDYKLRWAEQTVDSTLVMIVKR